MFENYAPPSEDGIPLCNNTFAILYNVETKTPAWVVERLTLENLDGRASRQKSSFKKDPRLKIQATLSDYRGSGYDRGHMAPAANLKAGQVGMDQSFLLSNIAPQVGVGFNRGVWRLLEEDIRDQVETPGEAYIITGPVFYDFEPTIGPNRVVVPDAFFKVFFDPETGATKAWLISNEIHKGMKPEAFQVPLEKIEWVTGFRF